MGVRFRLALCLALCLALAACGDDGNGGPDADVSIDAGNRPDADTTDARPGAPDGAMIDAVALDAGLDATPGLLPDLVAEAITRDGSYYRVLMCNRGLGTDLGLHRVRLAHLATGDSFETAAIFAVPAVNECVETGGITCGLVGDAGCDTAGNVLALVDSGETIVESDESNNSLAVFF